MNRKEAKAKPHIGISGKIAKLSEPYFTSVQDCVEQAVSEEQQQSLSDTAAAEHEE